MAGETQNTKIGTEQGGAVSFIKDGGKQIVESGGEIELQSGAILDIQDGATINGQTVYINAEITDISTSGSYWVVPGFAGTITKITTVTDGATTGADAVLTFKIGGTAITGSSITIDDAGSAAGVVDSSTPTALNVVTAVQAVELITNGGSTNTVKAKITIEMIKA